MVKQITSKSTKTEIVDAYNELIKENQVLKKTIDELKKEKTTTVVQKPQIKETKPLVEVVKGATITDIIHGLDHLRLSFGSASSELSAKLTSEATRLQKLRKEVEDRIKQLKEVHDIEVKEDKLDEMIKKYIEKTECFEAEIKQKSMVFEEEMAQKKQAWQKEQEEHSFYIKDRNETLKKMRQREADEYKYEREHTRTQEAEQYEQNKKRLNDELEAFLQKKRNEWEDREKAIAEKERLFEEYRLRIESFPKEKDAAVHKAKDDAVKLVESEAKIQANLREKDVEGEKRTYEFQIKSLEETIKKQAIHIESFYEQVNGFLKRAQELAVKAIEGASTASAYQAAKEIALE